MFRRKALGPVVAISLFIVVTVVSVIGFQTWFNTFSSSIISDVESKNGVESIETYVDAVSGTNLYFMNGDTNISISDVQIDGVSCSSFSAANYTNGLKTIDIGNCTNNASSSAAEVVVFSNKGIFSKKIFIKSSSISGSGGSGFDSMPNAFSFTDNSSAEINTLTISNNITPSGYDSPLNVSVVGSGLPQFSINGGAWTSSNASINLTDSIRIRLTSSSSYETSRTANLTIGDYTTTWNVTTKIACDPFWNNVELLLDFETGLLNDSSRRNRTVTLTDTVSQSSAQSQFGTYSAFFNNGYLYTGVDENLTLLGNNFTIEFFMNATGYSNYKLVDYGNHGSSYAHLYLGDAGYPGIGVYTAGQPLPANFFFAGASVEFLNKWRHVAYTRSGTNFKIFVNGNEVASTTNSNSFSGFAGVRIGRGYTASGGGFPFYGYIDNMRITLDVSRYNSNFTPPSQTYPTTSCS